MFGQPINDTECLSKITEEVAEAAETEDVRNLARHFDSTKALAAWIRSLPQRNDSGDLADGPRVACDVSQRLRIPADDPNCVERAALYMAAGELIEPGATRQLATIETPIGRHTFPVENDRPIKLDPRVPRNALEAGLFRMSEPDYIDLSPRETLEWISSIATEPANQHRNGQDRLRNARGAFLGALRGQPIPRNAIGDVGFVLALASQAARMFGVRGTEIVRIGTLALSEAAKRRAEQRNVKLQVGGVTLRPNLRVLESIARTGANLGLRIGSAALQAKLAQLGVSLPILREVEAELNREGLTLGALAKPPPMPGSLAAVTTEALMRQRVASRMS